MLRANRRAAREPIPAAAAVLAGGRSSRMGRDKAVLRVKGRRLVDLVCARLAPLFPEILVAVGRRRLTPPPGARVVRDRFPGRGPVAGIHAALRAARHEAVFIVACDMPRVSPRLAQLLWHRLAGARGAVPTGPRGPEPLCAFYRRDLAGPLARRLRRGALAARDLARLPGVCRIAWRDVRRADPTGVSFVNVNRPADLALLPRRRGAVQ